MDASKEARPRSNDRRIRGLAAVIAAVVLASLGLTSPATAAPATAGAVPEHEALWLRSIFTAEFGLVHPTGVVYAPDQRALFVAGAHGSETRVGRLTQGEELQGDTTLPAGDAGTLAYDAHAKKLAMLAGTDVLTVPAGKLKESRPAVTRVFVRDAGVRKPAGATFDASGALLVLDGDARTIVRIAGDASTPQITRIPLPDLGGAAVRGIALNPADGLLYVGTPSEQRLYGIEQSGNLAATYDVSSVRLADVQSFAFAPSADPTDDPATQSLFVADAGTASAGGQVAEMSLAPLAALALTPEPTVRVQTIAASLWVPGAPDTSGIAYDAAKDRLVVSDSEVEEVTGAGYHDVNLWQATRTGTVTDTGTTFPAFSAEPTGLALRESDNALLVSDDNANAVTFVKPGADGRHGTADDVRTTMSTMPLSDDTEDVAYDSVSGDVYLIDGVSKEVFHVNAGPNGAFGDADDVWSQFDVEQYGAGDPEGITYRPGTGTLLVADQPSHALYELTTAGALLHIFDLRSAPMLQVADVVVAPGTMRPERSNVWLVDRGVDNGPDPNENDGRIYELSIDPSGNTAPVVDSVKIDQTTPKTNDVLTTTVTAHDADNDPLVYRYTWRKNGVAIPNQTNPTLDLSVLGNGDKGDVISVRVVAFDGIAESAARTSAQRTIVDSVPAFNQDLGAQANSEGDVVNLSAGATDADGDALTYEASGLPPGLAIDSATGLVSGAVAADATAGSPYNVSITVRQGAVPDATDTFTWTIGVRPPNQPPVVSSVTIDQSAPHTNDTLTTTVVASDPEGSALTYAYQWSRNGIDITGATGPSLALSVAGNGDKGDTIGVRVTVSDGTNNTGPVSAAPVTVANTSPTFNQDLANRASVEGNAISLSAAASDADNDANVYGATGLPTGLSINTATGLISGTIAAGAATGSPYAVSITVNDGAAPNVVDTFTWTVTALNPPPAVPAGLTAAVTSRAVELDWANNTDGDLAGYNVFRSASASGPFTKLNATTLTTSQYSDTAAPQGTSFYRVTAVDTAAQQSTPSTTSATRRIMFRSAATGSAKDAANVIVNKPSGVATGDLLLAALDVRQAPTITAPAGWTLLRTDTNGTTMRQAVYYRVATASEPTSYRWTFSANRSAAATIVAYRGVATATPVDASSGRTNASSTSVVANSVTTTVPNALLVGFFGLASSPSVNPPIGMIEAAEVKQSGGQNKMAIEAADALLPTAGATGNRTAVASGAAVNIGQLVAIRPAS